MTTIFIRLFIVYFTVVFSVRIMGKRQIGELQLSELVTTIFISELAADPITDSSTPILYGIVPILILLAIEVILSFLSTKFKPFQRAFDNSPSILIRQGVIMEGELEKSRITLEELMSQIRLKGIEDISKVHYAILEPNGQVSVLPKAQTAPPAAEDMNIAVEQKGIAHTLISQGRENEDALKYIGKNSSWLRKKLSENKVSKIEDVLLMTCDDLENIVIVKKGKNNA